MRKLLLLSVVVSFLIFSPCEKLSSETQTSENSIKLDIKEFNLKNGLKVLVLERHASPTIAASFFFRVGSVNERPGITGISHFVEHMLFKGTKIMGTKDYQKEKPILDEIEKVIEKLIHLTRAQKSSQITSEEESQIKSLQNRLEELTKKHREYQTPPYQIYMRHGFKGVNAYTSEEVTSYYCEFPANKLELWAWIESDRFTNPVWRGFYQEKGVIMEERRMGYEVDPDGALYEHFKATAYLAHPLRWPVIGWMSDIEAITPKQLEEHFRQYYAPNNAIVAIVGNVEATAILSLMRKYFEPIPPSPNLPSTVTTEEPPQLGERRISVEFDAQPRIIIGYHTTTVGSQDAYTLDVISEILSGGRSSKFYRELVEKKKLCLSIRTNNETGKYAGLFIISATPCYPHSTQEVEEAIYQELERLKTETVSEQELTKAKKSLKANFLRRLNSNLRLSQLIGYYETVGSYKYIYNFTTKWNAVTAEDIKKVAAKYFTTNNRTVATLISKSKK